MNDSQNAIGKNRNRRSFLKNGLAVAGVATLGADLLSAGPSALAQSQGSSITRGDADILRFLAAGEAVEADFWDQYCELGGIQDKEVKGGRGNQIYTDKLRAIDRNLPQYIHDTADDETSHLNFLNAYLVSKGFEGVNLEKFRTLHGSTATGASKKLRLTNLMELKIDTSWYTRYRSAANNPDINPIVFEQAVPDLHKGTFTAIPRSDDDLFPEEHIQAIANTAVFHMPTVEQGGGSLRLALAQRATSVEVLRILISMGPIESMHFQTFHEKAGFAPPLTDPTNGLTFPNLNSRFDPNGGAKGQAVRDMFQTNLIMPEPCPFINPSLPLCSVIRPTNTVGAAMGAANFLIAMGLFTGQSDSFLAYFTGLAEAADAAQRGA